MNKTNERAQANRLTLLGRPTSRSTNGEGTFTLAASEDCSLSQKKKKARTAPNWHLMRQVGGTGSHAPPSCGHWAGPIQLFERSLCSWIARQKINLTRSVFYLLVISVRSVPSLTDCCWPLTKLMLTIDFPEKVHILKKLRK